MNDSQQVRVLETEWWSMALPPEWRAEQDEELILVGDEDGVGVIEMSTLHKVDGQVDPGELEAFMAEQGAAAGAQAVQCGVFRGYHQRSEEDGDALREWWLAGGSLLLYVTYSCDREHAGLDDSVVDQILDTLEFSAETDP